MVFGAGRANDLVNAKSTPAATIPAIVYAKTLRPSPGGGKALGPCGPNAIQYAICIK